MSHHDYRTVDFVEELIDKLVKVDAGLTDMLRTKLLKEGEIPELVHDDHAVIKGVAEHRNELVDTLNKMPYSDLDRIFEQFYARMDKESAAMLRRHLEITKQLTRLNMEIMFNHGLAIGSDYEGYRGGNLPTPA